MKYTGTVKFHTCSIWCMCLVGSHCFLILTAGLLQENSKLMEEKRELEKLYSKDKEAFERNIRDLELHLEEQRESYEKQIEDKKVLYLCSMRCVILSKVTMYKRLVYSHHFRFFALPSGRDRWSSKSSWGSRQESQSKRTVYGGKFHLSTE